MCTPRSCVLGDCGIDLLNKVRVECGCKADGLWVARCVFCCEAVQTFFVEDDRDSEPCVLDEKFLQGVGQNRHVVRVQPSIRIAQTGNLTDTVF